MPSLHDAQAPVLDRDLQPPGREGADEHHLLGVLADVDEAAGAGEARAELADVEIALLVRLGETKERGVEPAAVVEVELVGLVDHALRVDRGAEAHASRRHAADHSRLRRERHQVGDLLLAGNIGNTLGHADAEIDDAVGVEFERRPARDDLALVQLHRGNRSGTRADFAAERRVVLHREGLPVVLGLRHHDTVDQDAGNLHLARIERATLGGPLHLRDDEAARVARRHRDCQHLERERFLLHCDVAVGIGGRSTHDADIDRECAIEQVLLALEFDHPDQVILGAFVDLAAAVTRIDECSEPDPGDVTRPSRRDVAEQVRHDALREVVGLDLIGDRELLQLGNQSPVPPDHAAHQPVAAEMIEPAFLAVALARRIDQGKVARLAGSRR